MIAIIGGYGGWHGLLTIMSTKIVWIFQTISCIRLACSSSGLHSSCLNRSIVGRGRMFATIDEIFEIGMGHGQRVDIHKALRFIRRMFGRQEHTGGIVFIHLIIATTTLLLFDTTLTSGLLSGQGTTAHHTVENKNKLNYYLKSYKLN